MTIDEAVDLIKDRPWSTHNEDCDCVFCEALHMSVRALKQIKLIQEIMKSQFCMMPQSTYDKIMKALSE